MGSHLQAGAMAFNLLSALATIVATCLVEETAAQLGLAIAIEAGCMVAEYVLVRSPTCTCK